MAAIKTNSLFQLWNQKEAREGRRIPLTEVAQATGLAPETIRKVLNNETSRFDAPVLIALCQFFDVSTGPVPFLVFDPDSNA